MTDCATATSTKAIEGMKDTHIQNAEALLNKYENDSNHPSV